MKTTKIIAILLATIGSALPISAVAREVELPFSDNFDTHGVGSYTGAVWSFQAAFAPTVTNTPTPKDGSAGALYSLDQVTLTITNDLNAINSRVFCSFYTKVTAHDTAPSLSDEAAAFYVSTNGDLYANNTNTWVKLASGISTNGWIGVAVQLDYASSNWNFYMASPSAAFGATLIKKNEMPLAFNSNYTPVNAPYKELAKVEISGETYVDNFSAIRTGQSITSGTPSPTNMVSGNGTYLKLNDLLSGAALQYFTGGTGYLHTAFGVALGSLLTAGDEISVWVNGSWRTFEFTGINFSPEGVYTTTNTPITMTTGLQFNLAGSGNRQNAFFISYNTLASPSTTPINEEWNLLAIPMTHSGFRIDNGSDNFVGFAPSSGDRIYLRRSNQWVGLRYITVDGSSRWVRSGTRAATEAFPAGSSFWYKRASGAGNVSWTF